MLPSPNVPLIILFLSMINNHCWYFWNRFLWSLLHFLFMCFCLYHHLIPGDLGRKDLKWLKKIHSFPGSSAGKESTCNVQDLGLIPGLGRSPREGKGYPLQYSGLENPHGQRSLAGYSPWGRRVGHDWATKHLVGLTKCGQSWRSMIRQREGL